MFRGCSFAFPGKCKKCSDPGPILHISSYHAADPYAALHVLDLWMDLRVQVSLKSSGRLVGKLMSWSRRQRTSRCRVVFKNMILKQIDERLARFRRLWYRACMRLIKNLWDLFFLETARIVLSLISRKQRNVQNRFQNYYGELISNCPGSFWIVLRLSLLHHRQQYKPATAFTCSNTAPRTTKPLPSDQSSGDIRSDHQNKLTLPNRLRTCVFVFVSYQTLKKTLQDRFFRKRFDSHFKHGFETVLANRSVKNTKDPHENNTLQRPTKTMTNITKLITSVSKSLRPGSPYYSIPATKSPKIFQAYLRQDFVPPPQKKSTRKNNV